VEHIEASLFRYQVFAQEAHQAGAEARKHTQRTSILHSLSPTSVTTIANERKHAAALRQEEEADGARARETLALAFTEQNDCLERLSRYEVAIERSLYRALHELQRLQAARQGRGLDTQTVVDVEVSTPAD